MFCPQCGTTQGEELKFCKSCGANLYAVRQVVTGGETGEKFDWNKTWLAEMLLSHEELKKRKLVHDSTPEEKRFNEIKAGVITSCVGIGLMIFLYVLMQGIILGGKISPAATEILSRIWIAGVIPLFVGIALLINGFVVSRKLAELAWRGLQQKDTASLLESKETASTDLYESGSPQPSVTENTTRELRDTR